MLENIILGIISQHDASGYDIKKIIETKLSFFYKASYGNLYPALKRLLQKGYATTYEQSQGARQRIIYQITKEGTSHFLEWLTTPMQVNENNNRNLVKVYFYDLLPKETKNDLLKQYEQANIEYLNQLEQLEKELYEKVDLETYYYQFSTLYYGIATTKSTIAWCQHIRSEQPLRELLQPFDHCLKSETE